MSDSAAQEVVAGRFRLLRRLARGGTGEVFAATDQSTGQQVALKRLLAQESPRTIAVHFMREYHALSALRHPRIIEVYEYGVDRGLPYYTMELLDGHDLSELSPLPYREACGYLRDVASSLALLHARRLLHRDVSPRNVHRTSDGRCKLLDFGAMIPFGTPRNLIGTPPCIAPEALQGGALDQRSDLYSLGALAYYVLTRHHAYPASEISALPATWRQGVVAPNQRVAEIPEALDRLVLSLLSFDPAKRPASAAEVIDWLSAIGGLKADDNLAVGRSFLVSTQLIGRNAECAQLQDRLTKTTAGNGSAILISGDPGTGKTRMLSEAALIGQTCGLTVVRTAMRKQRGVASSWVDDLVSSLKQVAPMEAARASASRPLVADALSGSFPDANRKTLLAQVEQYVCEVARDRPLLITVDDLHHADELTGAVVAALAHRTRDCAMALIASHDAREQPSVLTITRGLASTLRLNALDRAQIAMLSASLFGIVPNLERIDDWFFKIAQGNPKITVELAERLLARGTLRYVDGNWVLPDEIAEPLPQDTANALMQRLEPLGADARGLAELLSVRRGGASAELLLVLAAPHPPDVVFKALEELVRAGVLGSAGDEYAYVQDALRVEVAHSLEPAQRQKLHKLWADYLLAQPKLDQDAQLEAGWHLVHTADEFRGAQLLADVAPELVERRVSMAAAVPALERALEVFERRDGPLTTRLRLRALLVLCGYLFDFRLADRYGFPTLDALYPFTGLGETQQFARWVGKTAGFVLGIAWAELKRLLRPAAQRGPNVIAALKYYAQSTMGLLGLRGLAVDVPGVAQVLERMRVFDGLPHPTLSAVYLAAEAIHLHGQGRGAEVHRSIERALAKLEQGQIWQMSRHEHVDLTIGLLLLQGMNETYREHSRSLECAAKLERIGTPLAAAASLRVCMAYYLLRGDAGPAQHYRRLLELTAIQNGSHWQVEWMAVPLEGLSGATWSDLIAMRRALESADRLAQDAPALELMREALRIPYLFRRGEYVEAAAIGDEYIRRHPPLTRIGWPAAYAMTALAHVHLGKTERALAICEESLACLTQDDLDYFVFYSPLEAAYATALALSGQREKSREVFNTRIARLRACGEHARAIVMHEYRVKVARMLDDRAELAEALEDVREAALLSRNPSVIALAQRLSEERGQRRDSPLPPAAASEITTLSVFLSDVADADEHAKRALAVLCQYADCSEGYLYFEGGESLTLLASFDELVPPPELLARLQKLKVANDTERWSQFEPGYRAYRLSGGFAVLRTGGRSAEVPDAMLAEIGRSLQRWAS